MNDVGFRNISFSSCTYISLIQKTVQEMASKMKTFYVKQQYDGDVSEDNFKLVEEDMPVINSGGKFTFTYQFLYN